MVDSKSGIGQEELLSHLRALLDFIIGHTTTIVILHRSQLVGSFRATLCKLWRQQDILPVRETMYRSFQAFSGLGSRLCFQYRLRSKAQIAMPFDDKISGLRRNS